MGERQDLMNAESIEKIRTLTANQTALFCTWPRIDHMMTRPMYTQGVDDDGTVWFFSGANSHKNQDIAKDSKVELLYANQSSNAYLALVGHASLSRDQKKIDELWSQFAKTWFPEGKDDPNLMLIAVKPTVGHYWDTKHNRMVQLAGIAIGAITGQQLDDGREGNLKL